MGECIFCQIVNREIPADILHVSDHVVAFRDLNPEAPVHILLVPKEHIESMREINDKNGHMLAELFEAAHHLARAEEVDRSGWRMVANVGPDAGQSVHHLHYHLLGGRQMAWPPG